MAKVKQSKNFEKVKSYYDLGIWSIEQVRKMVTNPKSNPWITAKEFKEITGEDYEA